MENEINYAEELTKLKNTGDFWKPEAGSHKVLFLSDGERHTSEFDGKIVDKCRFKIEVKTIPYTWDVTIGTTHQSLWGQLMHYADHKGQLDGSMITLLVNGKGKEKKYTVQEAIELLNADN